VFTSFGLAEGGTNNAAPRVGGRSVLQVVDFTRRGEYVGEDGEEWPVRRLSHAAGVC